jgi:hypothetical protein
MTKKQISEVKKKYRFHEIDSFCCWMCINLDIVSHDKMYCNILKIKTEPSNLCSAFKR